MSGVGEYVASVILIRNVSGTRNKLYLSNG